jgi:HEAT repeat protein
MLKKSLIFALLLAALPVFAQESGPGPIPALTEDECIAMLAPESDWNAKDVACRRLRQIGTAKSVPLLAPMLTDEKLGHLARYALEKMTVKEAGAALRDAAAKATGPAKAGAIISLGVRRDADAVAVIAPGLHDENLAVLNAAAGALGRIGNAAAVAALMEAAASPSEAARPALGEGLLAAVEHLTSASKSQDAVKICVALQDAAWPEQVRFGAYRGLINAERAKANERLIAALGGADEKLRDYAAFLVATMPRVSATKGLTDALPTLPVEGQAALLTGLAGRGDSAARAAVLAAVASPDPNVQLAAIRATGALGTAQDVVKLTSFLGGESEAASEAARTALSSTKAANLDTALAKAFPQASPNAKPLLLAVLAERMATETNAIAKGALADVTLEVRVAALEALAKLGNKDDVPAVIGSLKVSTDPAEQSAGSNALDAIAGMQKDDALPAITAELASAPVALRGKLLGALVRIGSENALQAYLGELANGPLEGRDEALRQFAGWPTRDAAPHLLEIARNDEAHRADLLRGYVRLATGEPDGAVKAQMLADAMGTAQRVEEKWIVLPGWGSLATQQSIDTLKPMLDDTAIRNEAGLALISASAEFGKQGEEQKKSAVDALNAVVEKADNEAVKERAKKALEKFAPPAA